MENRLTKGEVKAGMVAELRKIRDTFSLEIMNLSFQEEKELIEKKRLILKTKSALIEESESVKKKT